MAPAARRAKIYEAQDEIKQQAYAEIAKARFAIEGTSNYPDATFTLRLSYGAVRGYEEDGKQIPALTNFAGLYQRARRAQEPAAVRSAETLDRQESEAESENDVQFRFRRRHHRRQQRQPGREQGQRIRRHHFRRQHSIARALDCTYTDKQARAVSVDSAAITEALRKVYDARRAGGRIGRAGNRRCRCCVVMSSEDEIIVSVTNPTAAQTNS